MLSAVRRRIISVSFLNLDSLVSAWHAVLIVEEYQTLIKSGKRFMLKLLAGGVVKDK